MDKNQIRTAYSDEISLVDLAAIFVRRRRVFYVSVVLVTVLGVAYALLKSDKYEYVTLLESAEKFNSEYIEDPAATVAAVKNRWIPEVISSYQAQADNELPFKIQTSNPANTGLIRIVSEADEKNADLVERTHRALAASIIERQKQLLDMQQNGLRNQIASIEEVIKSLQSLENSESAGSALASAIQKRAELKGGLESLKPAGTLVVARQSIEQQGMGRLFIVAIAVVLGGMLGGFLAFFAEFIAQVRENLGRSAED